VGDWPALKPPSCAIEAEDIQEGQTVRQLTDSERVDLDAFTAAMPYQTNAPVSGRSSDLTNVLFISSRAQIVTAFAAAGWTQAKPASLRSRIEWIRSPVQQRPLQSCR
jgi:hypothetical protein